MPKPFVLLDRDGTLIVERNYLADPDQVELIPGATEGLRELQRCGFGLAVVTNQSGVGRGYFDAATVESVHHRMVLLLAAQGIRLDGIYYCPHTPEDECDCRKPRTGLVKQAVAAHGFDPHDSYVIGDKACDIDLGRNVGAATILVRTGYGKDEMAGQQASPDQIADDLIDAARMIMRALHAWMTSQFASKGSRRATPSIARRYVTTRCAISRWTGCDRCGSHAAR